MLGHVNVETRSAERSSEVDTGSRQEDASKQELEPGSDSSEPKQPGASGHICRTEFMISLRRPARLGEVNSAQVRMSAPPSQDAARETSTHSPIPSTIVEGCAGGALCSPQAVLILAAQQGNLRWRFRWCRE
jgi:hypothetical protein